MYRYNSEIDLEHYYHHHRHHHHHHHHLYVMELGHLLTRSGLTYPEVSTNVSYISFCQLQNSVQLPWVIYHEAFYIHVLPTCSCFPVICPELCIFISFVPCEFILQSAQAYPAVLLIYLISAPVILLPSLAVTV